MRKEFYDDLFMYETIKQVIRTDDDNKVFPIFRQLEGTKWTIGDIERLNRNENSKKWQQYNNFG